jgi:Ca2+-transporting ATPase
LQWRELSISVVQGLVIACGTLGVYQFALYHGHDELLTRSMVFTTLVVANIFLTLVDRSFYYSIFTSMSYRNNLLLIVLAVTVSCLFAMLYIPVLQHFFGFARLTAMQLGISAAVGFVSVIWFEFYKLMKRMVKR